MTRRIPGARFAAAAGLTFVLVGTGALAGHAGWTAQTAKTVPVSAATISATTSGAPGLTAKYTAGLPGVFPPVLSRTAPVTVSNTGDAPLAFDMTVAGGTAALNDLISVQAWKQNGTCTESTTPDTATLSSGRLSSPPGLNTSIGVVGSQSTLALCIRTTLDSAFPSDESTTTPTVSFTGRVGANWTATTTAAPFTQRAAHDWFQIVQSSTAKCLATSGAAAAVRQNIVNASCSAPLSTSNQAFRLVASDGDFYRLLPGNGTGVVVSGRPAGLLGLIPPSVVGLVGPVTGTSTAALQQQWRPVAHGAAGDYQLVHREAGLCLTMPSTFDNTTATITTCTTSTSANDTTYRNQHFRLIAIP